MARSKKEKSKKNKSSGRAIWKGSISFGLVSIPVGLYAAEASSSLDFDLLDRRDFAPIKYQRVNKQTGREVLWNQIIKGYEYKKGDYVTLTDAEFRKANVEATQSIDILDFVAGGEISPMYYDKPYYLGPLDNGRAYSLLREVLDKLSKVAIARVVIRTRQHLAAVIPHGSMLVLNLLRFDHELRDAGNLDIPKAGSKQFKISAGELKMAERLVESMAGAWKPKQYHDEYREDLLKMIDKKIKSGRLKIVSEDKAPARKSEGKVVDIMHLLRRSVDQAQKKEAAPRRRKAG
ncbi:MAG: Ku protein [Deltaproteobacteria bacterium]|nr:Ku protein [Deltaproteobacteria bacterium]